MQRTVVKLGVAACVLALMAGGLSLAQQGGRSRGGQGGQGGPGARGNFDPAQMRQMMTQRMKEQLGVKDDAEWQIIEPRLTKVMTLSRDAAGGMRGMFGMFGGRGGPGGPGGRSGDNNAPQTSRRGPGSQGEQTAVEKAMTQLETVLQKESSSSEEIKTALTNLRSAREKAQIELTAAQEDLKKVLTVRQEALLVARGMLR